MSVPIVDHSPPSPVGHYDEVCSRDNHSAGSNSDRSKCNSTLQTQALCSESSSIQTGVFLDQRNTSSSSADDIGKAILTQNSDESSMHHGSCASNSQTPRMSNVTFKEDFIAMALITSPPGPCKALPPEGKEEQAGSDMSSHTGNPSCSSQPNLLESGASISPKGSLPSFQINPSPEVNKVAQASTGVSREEMLSYMHRRNPMTRADFKRMMTHDTGSDLPNYLDDTNNTGSLVSDIHSDQPSTTPTMNLGRSMLISGVSQGLDSAVNLSAHPTEDTDVDPVVRFRRRPRSIATPHTASHFQSRKRASQQESIKKRLHHLNLPGRIKIPITMDRLAFMAILDRNSTMLESVLAVVMAVIVSLLGGFLFFLGEYQDFWMFVLCFVIGSSQFCLLKSVQPDSASPVHGHNNIILFSRAFYFSILAACVCILDVSSRHISGSRTLFGVPVLSRESLIGAKNVIASVILCLPVVFVFGLLPQVSTLALFLLEQVEIHVFGGTALMNLPGALVSFCKNVVTACLLYILCVFGLQTNVPTGQSHPLFSLFCALMASMSFLLSRYSSDLSVMWQVVMLRFRTLDVAVADTEFVDPLPAKLRETVAARMEHDVIVCVMVTLLCFAVHFSTAFVALQPTLNTCIIWAAVVMGILNHYLLPQLRKKLPWLVFSEPFFHPSLLQHSDRLDQSSTSWYEVLHVWTILAEKYVVYPVLFFGVLSYHAPVIVMKFGPGWTALVLVVCGMKMFRSCFNNPSRQHVVVAWTVLFFQYDCSDCSETFPLDYFVSSIFVDKLIELLLKVQFLLTYNAPWQISCGSLCHAFAHPLSVPHSGMVLTQAAIASALSAPLMPVAGSAIFMMSYPRPTKFWEKNYNTRRSDNSNTRMVTQVNSYSSTDDSNLNSVFYEHMTRSLQRNLCGDLMLGRLGKFQAGDCFILASDYLNAMVHIIEVGNGLVTFQLRGLEFKGTYCQQREVEAINEDVAECECCELFHVPRLISFGEALSQRWLSWEVAEGEYLLESYSVAENPAFTMFSLFDLKKMFIMYYVKCIIYYTITSTKLLAWLSDESMMSQMSYLTCPTFVDMDVAFHGTSDDDFDLILNGVTRAAFITKFMPWINYCNAQRTEPIPEGIMLGHLVTLCFGLSLLGRRLLSTATYQQIASLKSFLYGLHALFKGDVLVTSAKDEWVFCEADMAFLHKVVCPAIRLALKFHQDHFVCMEEEEDSTVLYTFIKAYEENWVIVHEGHPKWRQSILQDRPFLLSMRHVVAEGTSDDYKVIMLSRRVLSFRVIKVNRECVRGLWASQLQELVFLRNRDPERGSIQNASQALRNMINSSCDQPIGYPIYVSPLMTSYAETHTQFCTIAGTLISGSMIHRSVTDTLQKIRRQCSRRYARATYGSDSVNLEMMPAATTAGGPAGCSKEERVFKSGGRPTANSSCTPKTDHLPNASRQSMQSASSSSSLRTIGDGAMSTILPAGPSSPGNGHSAVFRFHPIRFPLARHVRNLTFLVTNPAVLDRLDWPSERLRMCCSPSRWKEWTPFVGMCGDVLGYWDLTPSFAATTEAPNASAIAGRRRILLLARQIRFVAVYEEGVDIDPVDLTRAVDMDTADIPA